MIRYWKRCAAAVLSVCLAITVLPGKDIVLCIGENGHMALESAQNGRCDEGFCRPLKEAPRPPQCARNDDACGDCISCVDIPLTQGPVAGPSASPANPQKKVAGKGGLACMALSAVPGLNGAAFMPRPTALPPPDIGFALPPPSRILRI